MKFCRASAWKPAPQAPAVPAALCGSAEHVVCSVARELSDGSQGAACPLLADLAMQYCSAASVRKFTPPAGSVPNRCTTAHHRYCDVYLDAGAGRRRDDPDPGQCAAGIAVPDGLFYSVNHMWVEMGEDGSCQVGIDGLLARMLGRVRRVRALPLAGFRRPGAVLTLGSLEIEVVFPNPVLAAASNVHLRSDPGRLTAAPYSFGWLFEGTADISTAAGLLRGEAARRWMRQEVEQIAHFVREECAGGGNETMADGGLAAAGLMESLTPDAALRLYGEFFSPSRVSWGQS